MKDTFIKKISYNYSGNFPTTAYIRLFVGTDHAGKDVYYTQLNLDGTVNEKESNLWRVDEEGFITVKQNYGSDYVITTEKPENPKQEENSNSSSNANSTTNNKKDNLKNDTTISSPKGGDKASLTSWFSLLSSGVLAVLFHKRRQL